MLFSSQISGFSADFLRKSLDIVKQHLSNAEIWADSLFQPSNQKPTLVNVSSTVRFDKNWKLEKNWGFGVPKEAKTGNIRKKSPVADGIGYVKYLSMQKVNMQYFKQQMMKHTV